MLKTLQIFSHLPYTASVRKCVLILCTAFFTQYVFAQPTITSFTPTSGSVGTTVTITGTNFSATPANNIVYFGGVKATVSAATATSITTTVPVGATYQPITVTNTTSGLTAYSAQPFKATFTGGGASFTASSFATKVDATTGINPFYLTIGDFDGDGKPDIAVTNFSANSVSVLRNTSSSGTVSFAPKFDIATGTGPIGICTGDLDGDGKLDIAVVNYTAKTVSVLRNTSTSGNLSFAPKVDSATTGNPYNLTIRDYDADGKPDIAVANYTSTNTISLLRNTSTVGTISFATKADFTVPGNSASIASGDLDGDSKPDIAVANYNNAGTAAVFKNNSTTGTMAFAVAAMPATNASLKLLSIGDVDGDAKPDIAVTNYSSNTVSVIRNTSTGGTTTFAPKVDFATGTNPFDFAIGDIDGDGKPDIAVANYGSGNISALRNTSTSGAVSFDPKVDYATGPSYSLAIGDLDGNGKPDIVTANYNSNTISVLRNLIGGTLPLRLLAFSGKAAGNQAQLQWQTSAELNSADIVVEYSTDGINFSLVGTVTAAGNSTGTRNYSFTHADAKKGVNYYRLKMLDADGKFTYSYVVRVQLGVKSTVLLLYPNPAKEFVVVEHPASGTASIKVFDLTGRIIKTIKVDKDVLQTKMNVNVLAPGTYKMVWSDGVNTQSKSLVVQ